MNSTTGPGRQEYLAYIAPFVIYLTATQFESRGWLGWPHEYELLCTLKGGLVAAALWYWRRIYPPWNRRGCGLAIAAGILGCLAWIALDRVQSGLPLLQALLDAIGSGGRTGYDPFTATGPLPLRLAFVAVRLVEMILIVPVMEELFWRGFLARYLLADDFSRAPQGVFTPLSFLLVTLAFTSVHPEILAAFTWGALINLLYLRTANLWSCVLMHAVTNGLLGWYILQSGNWHLW